MQIVLRRKGDGMECEIELSPALADGLKYGFELASLAHVARKENRRLKLAPEACRSGLSIRRPRQYRPNLASLRPIKKLETSDNRAASSALERVSWAARKLTEAYGE